MKHFALVLFFIFCGNHSWARDPFDPVTPWPLDVNPDAILDQNIGGTWISCPKEDNCWILTITPWQSSNYHWDLYSTKKPHLRLNGVLINKDRYLVGYVTRALSEPEILLVYLVKKELKFQLGNTEGPRQQMIFQLWNPQP
jgi:hypothetical protein